MAVARVIMYLILKENFTRLAENKLSYNRLMFHTYILRCADDTLYVGCTNDLTKRLHQHNHAKAGAHYTKIRRPVTLVHKNRFIRSQRHVHEKWR